MWCKFVFLCLACLSMPQLHACFAVMKFTNVECLSTDRNFTEFALCRLQAIERNVAELNIRAKIYNLPKQKISMRWQLLKKANGFKPFLYNVTLPDLCEYLEKRNHPFVNIIFNSLGSNHNGNAKCPLQSELALEDFRFPAKALELLPLPDGEYALHATFSALEQHQHAVLKVFFMLAEF